MLIVNVQINFGVIWHFVLSFSYLVDEPKTESGMIITGQQMEPQLRIEGIRTGSDFGISTAQKFKALLVLYFSAE